MPPGFTVDFAGEGEWKITLDVFRDLGLAFGAAMIAIYILLVAQMGSFAIPLVVMLAIPLTILGVMPGFWLLNALSAEQVGGFLNPVYFTATGMIGMIALSGIVTRDSIILVDFIHLSLARGRSLFDAIMESRVVRLRPILLTATAAMLGAVPIIIDPIFSGLGVVADLRAVCLDTVHAVRDSGRLLAAVCQQARSRDALLVDGPGRLRTCPSQRRAPAIMDGLPSGPRFSRHPGPRAYVPGRAHGANVGRDRQIVLRWQI